uniref:MFS domain-containing protein n=1 Tax=Loa loa TaxID=7209 RepID=A0A1I7VT60_LOALO
MENRASSSLEAQDDQLRHLSPKPNETDDVINDSDDEQFLCGCSRCTPRWLQKFHNAKWLLVMLGICAFVQSFVVNSIFPVGLSTLEKRFHMTSTQTGIISSWYDFAILIAVFPVCHWGNTGTFSCDNKSIELACSR